MDSIVVENLTFGYYAGREALQNISFNLPRGEFLGLIGPNGGGKTTLLKILLGILPYTRGEVRIFGHQPSSRQARRLVSYVPQHSNVPKDFPGTVRDIIWMGVSSGIWPWRPRDAAHVEKFCQLVAFFDLERIVEAPISEISGGQIRRVLLVRALLREPQLLVLDEPMAGVDSSGNTLFFEFVHKLRQLKQISIIMSSHDVDILRAQAGRLMCLNRVIHFCDSAHLVSDQLLKHTYQCELETFYHNRDYHIFRNPGQTCQEQEKEHGGE
jgi:zinc transport system ATP-binding protein